MKNPKSSKKGLSFYSHKMKHGTKKNSDSDNSIDYEQVSKEIEKELDEILKELEQIKKEYYSKNIQLETIQKQTPFEIIKSVVQRYLNSFKCKKK